MYHAVKPGLSAYKDNPEEVRVPVETIRDCHVNRLLFGKSLENPPAGTSVGWHLLTKASPLRRVETPSDSC